MKSVARTISAFVVAGVISVSVCACGGAGGNDAAGSVPAEAATEQASELQKVVFDEPILVAKGGLCEIYVTGLYEDGNHVNLDGEPIVLKVIQTKIVNTSEYDIHAQTRSFQHYIGDENVNLVHTQGSLDVPAGRTNKVEFEVDSDTVNSSPVPIENFEDLYELEGPIEITKLPDYSDEEELYLDLRVLKEDNQ